jgi:hypothetical protein
VLALAALPDGDLVAIGDFTTAGGTAANRIARWDATTWQAVGAGLDGSALAVHQRPLGELAVGGNFYTAGGTTSARLARLTTPCAATATTSGAGCASSGGGNVLTTTDLPWLGGTFRATGTGMPTSAFVFAVSSTAAITPGLPLATVLPQALPGCLLHVSPDIVEAQFVLGGVASSQVPLPNTPALAGAVFFHQLVPFEVDALLNIVAISTTNALQLTIGSF